MASAHRRFFRRTSLLSLCVLAAACGSTSSSSPDETDQLISGATALTSHSSGTIIVNGQAYTLDSGLQVVKGTFQGTILEHLPELPPRPPDRIFWPNMLIKAHPRGVFSDYVVQTPGDTGTVHIDLGTLGWLQETFTVTSRNPLTYEHEFTGNMTLPVGDVPVLPWLKTNMQLVYTAEGTVTGTAQLRATVLRNGQQVQVVYPVQYSGTFSGQPVNPLPLTVTASVRFQQFNPNTGAFSGTESSRAVSGP